MRISGLHPDPVAAKILSERKLNSNFTEKLKLYLVTLGVTNPIVSWSRLRAFSSRLWLRSGIGKRSPPDPGKS
jgi:hypothetical protein